MPCAIPVFGFEAILCVKSTRCPRDGTLVLESSRTVPPKKINWVIFRVGSPEFLTDPDAYKWLGTERTTTNNLVPFQSVKPVE